MTTSWNHMNTDEKLDYLRIRIEELKNTIANLDSNLVSQINRALGNLAKKIDEVGNKVKELSKSEE